ncbi:small nuclear ribonucleoprotein G isoform 2-T2 [Salvelinus alpinus]
MLSFVVLPKLKVHKQLGFTLEHMATVLQGNENNVLISKYLSLKNYFLKTCWKLICHQYSDLFDQKRFMDKKLSLKLNGGRQVQGVLRGFDPFMNLVMDDCLEMAPGGIQNTIGMVVIRGNSIIMLEALERV